MSWGTVVALAGTPTFPQEVLDIIIGKFTADPATLRACSTVSSAFRLPSQRSLHSSVTIHLDFWRREHSVAQAYFFVTNPRIAGYAKILRILIVQGGRETCIDWHFVHYFLPNIQCLSLDSHEQQKWSDLTRELKLSILCMIRSPKLRELVLRGTVGFPENLLHSISGLLHLSISSNHAVGPIDLEFTPSPCPDTSRLLNLNVGSSLTASALLAAHYGFASSISLAHLRGFTCTHFNDMGSDVSSIQSILDLAAGSLTKVCINIKNEMWLEPTAPLSFQHLVAIQRLSLAIKSKSALDSSWGSHWICSALETVPENNALMEVKLYISYRLSQFADDETWTRLNELLTRPRHSMNLRRFIVQFSSFSFPFHCESSTDAAVADFFAQKMPCLVSRAQLTIDSVSRLDISTATFHIRRVT